MARWRLLNAHYLNVPGTEWERIEVSTFTGKQARVRYPVPLLLDPNAPNDNNYPGETIVAYDTKGGKDDIVFVGNPTPDMEPLDEEAQKISAEWAPKWIKPMSEDALPGWGDYGQALLGKLGKELTDAIKRDGGVPKAEENVSVSASEFELLKSQVAELARLNAELLAKTGKGAPFYEKIAKKKPGRPPGRPRKVPVENDSPV